ncbi:serine/threonine-protein phosphatase 6 regulatory ankyrin repeat subunit A-like [Trichogramma pretiosum]|uniref:serine/threonine-protein phosphatase 6 regulatory ankyrin repeat subunit A-like n=1 Tax=Trichogramma pretiosum TaxID=7493 RepID=UPI000C71A9AD|nr:serine/threonine-protein phosphatase 6 regulatory ankyrin repeat subunit A-like [Trichogramma pretiosum]
MADEVQGSSFLRRFYPWMKNWEGRLTNLLEIFRKEEIDWLLQESLIDEPNQQGIQFVIAVTQTDYKDEPVVGDDGKPSSSRTTALHHAARLCPFDANILVPGLFKIYDRFDVNYTDVESGLTHFHIACEFGCEEVVQRFLELGQDPNLVAANASVDPPLHTALKSANANVIELLLKHKADLNLTNGNGSTALHLICEKYDDFAEVFLRIIDESNQTLRVNVGDRAGETPLHVALRHNNAKAAKLLLRRGVDLNRTNNEIETPLHLICNMQDDLQVLFDFFEISEERKQTIDIDAEDGLGNRPLHNALSNGKKNATKLLLRKGSDPCHANSWGFTPLHLIAQGTVDDDFVKTFFRIADQFDRVEVFDHQDVFGRTPLHYAVASVLPNTVGFILDRGASLCGFVYPDESHFDTSYVPLYDPITFDACKLRRASGALMIAEYLVQAGYRIRESDALTIMTSFARHQMFEQPMDPRQSPWYEDEEFAEKARQIGKIYFGVTLHDLIRGRPEQAMRRHHIEDYYEFACSVDWLRLPEGQKAACEVHLCEKLARPFFRYWGVRAFVQWTGDRQLMERSSTILVDATNEELYRICLTAAGRELPEP